MNNERAGLVEEREDALCGCGEVIRHFVIEEMTCRAKEGRGKER